MAIDTSGLDALANLDDLSFGNLLTPSSASKKPQIENSGQPLSLPIELVYEDEDNIRSEENEGFSAESIKGLADQILKDKRGIKSPISVKSAGKDGRHKINHGARRYRAAIVAGLKVIPAFIDDAHDEYDQAIENIQRADLEPMEIALFIGKREAAGEKTNEIAARLGKSAGYISKHKSLLSLPMFLAELYEQGYKNLECLYEMQRASKKHAELVEEFVEREGVENLTLAKIRMFIASLDMPKAPVKPPHSAQEAVVSGESYGDSASADLDHSDASEEALTVDDNGALAPGLASAIPKEKINDPDKMKKTIVLVEHDGRSARLMLEKRPTIGYAWIKNEDDGHETEVDLALLKLTSLIEGA